MVYMKDFSTFIAEIYCKTDISFNTMWNYNNHKIINIHRGLKGWKQ